MLHHARMLLFVLSPFIAQGSGISSGIPDACKPTQVDFIRSFEERNCFEPAEIRSIIKQTPANRENSKVVFELPNGLNGLSTTERLSSAAAGIIAREALGYDVSWNCAENPRDGGTRILKGESDIIMEFALDDAEELMLSEKISDAGFIGYTAQDGLYVPDYTDDTYAEVLSFNSRISQFASESYKYWSTLSIPEIVQMYAGANDTTIIGDHRLESISQYTPPWCRQWSPDGSNNNCIDVKASFPRDGTPLHLVIENLRLNATVSYWGDRLMMYAYEKSQKKEPFVLKCEYLPKNIILGTALHRVSLPPFSQECYSGIYSASMNSTVACDYPPVNLRKITSATITAAEGVYHDLGVMIRRFSIDQINIDSLWVEASRMENAEFSVTCGWLRNGSRMAWTSWVQNSYDTPDRVTFKLSAEARDTIIAFTTVSITICLLTMTLILAYRNHVLIQGISMFFSILSLFGFLLLIGSSYFYIIDKPDAAVCTARMWFAPIGYGMAIASIGAKIYRLYRAFGANSPQAKELSNCQLSLFSSGMFGAVLITLVIEQAISPSGPKTTEVEDESANKIVTFHHCSWDMGFYFAKVSVLAFLTLLTTKLAYDSREAPIQYNEAKELGMALYTAVIAFLVGVPIIYWLRENDEYGVLRISAVMFTVILPTLMIGFLFFYRIQCAVRGITVDQFDSNVARRIRINIPDDQKGKQTKTTKQSSSNYKRSPAQIRRQPSVSERQL